MKIRIIEKSYREVADIQPPKHKKPMKQSLFFRLLLRVASAPDLWATHFRLKKVGMERLGKREPCLYLMNHSSFLDLEIASVILFPRRFSIVSTTDGFVGKNLLMRLLGCIPTKKFVTDLTLVKDMIYAVRTLKSSVLLFPEAGYSLDGRTTRLPDSLGQFVKMLGVPVVMIETRGAFARQPLYNDLHKRKVRVSAEMRYLLSVEDTKSKSAEEINTLIKDCFSFDAFAQQKEDRVRITEKNRADHLHRLLYKCPSCLAEGSMQGAGTSLTCEACGKVHHLTELGELDALDGKTDFSHIPDWYDWERACVRRELEDGSYRMESDVDIYMLVDTKALYRVGEGKLTHDRDGFRLVGCDGALNYHQKPLSSYTLNADYYWYEIGDVIGIGNQKALYYCFPKNRENPVTKARLATEELYNLLRLEKSSAILKQEQ
jgi:1-acyl-sn-glycerol-3-phosphate acyltransferase